MGRALAGAAVALVMAACTASDTVAEPLGETAGPSASPQVEEADQASPTPTAAVDAAGPVELALPAGSDLVRIDGVSESAFAVSGVVKGVVEWQGLLVAVGENCDGREPPEEGHEGGPCTPAVWTSPDGAAWERNDLAGTGNIDVVTVFDGDLLAGGRACGSSEERAASGAAGLGGCRPAVWRSSDAEDWTVHVLAEEEAAVCEPDWAGCAFSVWDLAATDEVVVAAGHDLATATRLWRSDDGVTWERANETGGPWPDGGYGWLDRVVASADGFLAVGEACDPVFQCHGAVWHGDVAGRAWVLHGPGPDDNPFGDEAAFSGTWFHQVASSSGTVSILGDACEGYTDSEIVMLVGCSPVLWSTDGTDYTATAVQRPEADPDTEFTFSPMAWRDGRLHLPGTTWLASAERPDWFLWSVAPDGGWEQRPIEPREAGRIPRFEHGIAVADGMVYVGGVDSALQPTAPAVWLMG